MISETLKEIADHEAKIIALQKKVESDRRKELAGLHKKLGFATRADLIDGLMSLDKGSRKADRPVRAVGPNGRAKRTRITDDLRSEIIAAVRGGEKGVDVAARFGVSVPTLHNIKKAAGLVNSRS